MEKFGPDTSHLNTKDNEPSFLNIDINENVFQVPDTNDFNGEFTYESAEKMTGITYLNYLRTYDDMI